MGIAVILPAAGRSRRFSAGDAPGASGAAGRGSKLEAELAGKPVFLRSVELFLGRPDVTAILLAVNPETIAAFKFRWGDRLGLMGVTVVPGGAIERWETVGRALEALRSMGTDATHVAVHDAARPLTDKALIDRVFAASGQFAAVVPGVPVNATLRRAPVDPEASRPEPDPLDALLADAGKPAMQVRRAVEAVDRRDLIEVQTPQLFQLELLEHAYAQIRSGRIDAAAITDDAGLIQAMGEPVYVVPGQSTNLKITHPEDLELAEALASRRRSAEAKAEAAKQLFVEDDEA